MHIVSEHFDNCIVVQAHSDQEAAAQLQATDWDVVLLDISTPGRGGLDILKDIKRARPRIPVLIFSMHPEALFAVRALRSGASGYVNKGAGPEELVEAIRKVRRGGKYISDRVADQLAEELRENLDKPFHEALSNREYQVMQALVRGKSVTEIAQNFSLSVKTVSTYRARILDKLHVNSLAQLVRYAIEQGLADS